LEKGAFTLAWALGATLFFTIGWMAAAPDDPHGAVSLGARSGALLTWVQLCALAVVSAALATLLAGRRVSDVGIFAVVIGLGALSLRGANATFILQQADDVGASISSLALSLGIESVAWWALIGAAAGASVLTARWCAEWLRPEAESGEWLALALYDVPGIGAALSGLPTEERTPARHGLEHLGVAVVASLVIMSLFSSSLATHGIRHGQACFLAGASLGVGAYVAFRVVPVRSALWSLLAVGVVGVISYLFASLRTGSGLGPAPIPAAAALRILPIQFIALGTAGVLFASWSAAGRAYLLRSAAEAAGARGGRGSSTATSARARARSGKGRGA